MVWSSSPKSIASATGSGSSRRPILTLNHRPPHARRASSSFRGNLGHLDEPLGLRHDTVVAARLVSYGVHGQKRTTGGKCRPFDGKVSGHLEAKECRHGRFAAAMISMRGIEPRFSGEVPLLQPPIVLFWLRARIIVCHLAGETAGSRQRTVAGLRAMQLARHLFAFWLRGHVGRITLALRVRRRYGGCIAVIASPTRGEPAHDL